MTHLVGLRIRNWCRFRGEHELALGPGIYGLVARDEEDERRSNWAGKSSLLAAIRWLFFGSRVLDADALDELISHGETEMAVEAELSDGTFISRQRVRGKAQRDLLFERGELKASGDGAQELIDRLVGLSEKDLLTTAWAEQGELSKLVVLKATPLTDIVAEWARLGRLEHAVEVAEREFGEAARTLSLEVVGRDAVAGNLEGVDVDVLEARVAELQQLHDTALLTRQNYQQLRDAWDERVRLRDQLLELERLKREAAVLEAKKVPMVDVEVKRLEQANNLASAELREAQKEQARLGKVAMGEFQGSCPVSPGFECPVKAQINQRQAENAVALERARELVLARQQASTRAAADYSAALASQRESAREEGKLVTVRDAMARADGASAALLKRGVRQPGSEEKAPELPAAFDATELWGLKDQLANAKSALANLPAAEERVARARRAVRVAKAAVQVLQAALRSASKGAVGIVTSEANRVLRRGGVDLQVTEAWARDTGKPAEHCSECGIAFPATARAKQCEGCGAARGLKARAEFRWRLSDRSGAAKDLAGLAVRCGALTYLGATREVGLSLGLLDEPLAACDAAHREAVIRHLGGMLGGFEQVIVADHYTGFMDGLPRRIVVTSDGKWSRVEVRG